MIDADYAESVSKVLRRAAAALLDAVDAMDDLAERLREPDPDAPAFDPLCVRGCGHTRHTGVCDIDGCPCPHGV